MSINSKRSTITASSSILRFLEQSRSICCWAPPSPAAVVAGPLAAISIVGGLPLLALPSLLSVAVVCRVSHWRSGILLVGGATAASHCALSWASSVCAGVSYGDAGGSGNTIATAPLDSGARQIYSRILKNKYIFNKFNNLNQLNLIPN